MAEIAERVHELICPGQWFDGASEFTIDRGTVEQIVALVADLETELSARRLVMAEQERIANMPRAYSIGG